MGKVNAFAAGGINRADEPVPIGMIRQHKTPVGRPPAFGPRE